MKIKFTKKLSKKGLYIFNNAATDDVKIENLGAEDWSKLKTLFDHLKEFKNADGTRKAGYGVLKLTGDGALSFLTNIDDQMSQSVKRALSTTKNTVQALPSTLLDDAPILRTLIAAARETVPLAEKSNYHLTIGLLRYDQNHEGLGAHKDGAQYVTTHLITKQGVEGAQSTFYYENASGDKCTDEIEMNQQLDSLAFNDMGLRHGVKAITITSTGGHRDIIVLGFHQEI